MQLPLYNRRAFLAIEVGFTSPHVNVCKFERDKYGLLFRGGLNAPYRIFSSSGDLPCNLHLPANNNNSLRFV